MEQKNEKQFVPGVFCRMPNDKAPNFILLDMSFKPHEFFTWCQDKMDSKGWVNIQVKRSTKGTIYAELNTWKPTKTVEQTEATEEYNNTKYQVDTEHKTVDPETGNSISLEDIPF